MMNVLNVILVWILFISTVVFVSGGTVHKRERRIIKVPKIMLPKIVFTSPIKKMAPVADVAKAIVPVAAMVAASDLIQNEEVQRQERVAKNSIKEAEEESFIEDMGEPDYQDYEPTGPVFVDDGLKINIPPSDNNEEHEMEETVQNLEETGRWEEKIVPETAAFEFDPNAFYADAIPMDTTMNTF